MRLDHSIKCTECEQRYCSVTEAVYNRFYKSEGNKAICDRCNGTDEPRIVFADEMAREIPKKTSVVKEEVEIEVTKAKKKAMPSGPRKKMATPRRK